MGNNGLDAHMLSCPLILMLFPVLTNLTTSDVRLRSCCNDQRELRDHLMFFTKDGETGPSGRGPGPKEQ